MKAYFDEHGDGPLPGGEREERGVAAAALRQRNAVLDSEYAFHSSYGWAVPLMPLCRKGKRLTPTLDQLEKLAHTDHRRLLVATAHGLVHGDAAGVHTGVLMENTGSLLGPTERFVETVARPTLDTLINLVAARHLGFEAEWTSSRKSSRWRPAARCRSAARTSRPSRPSPTDGANRSEEINQRILPTVRQQTADLGGVDT